MKILNFIFTIFLLIASASATDIYVSSDASGTPNWDSDIWTATEGNVHTDSLRPTQNDNVHGTTSSGTCVINIAATANCADLIISDSKVGLSGSSALNVYGSTAWKSGMTNTYSGTLSFLASSGTKTITSDTIPFKCSVTLNGAGAEFQLVDNMALGSSGLIFTKTAGTFTPGTNKVTLYRSTRLSGTWNFYDVDYIAGAYKTDAITLVGNLAISHDLTVNGNSATNRLLITSDTPGTPRTIHCDGTVTTSNVAFRDITFTHAVDLSAITGNSSDCGGNTGITFTSRQDCYFKVSGSGTKYISGANWYTTSGGSTGQRVPLAQDSAFVDANSGVAASTTINLDMPRMGNFSTYGVTNSPTISQTINNEIYGSLDLRGCGSMTGNYHFDFRGRPSRSLVDTLNSGGLSLYHILVNAPGSTVQLGADLTCSSTGSQLLYGTLDADVYNLSLVDYSFESGTTTNMGHGSLWTMTGTSGALWGKTYSTGTINSETSTVRYNESGISDVIFKGNGNVYYNIEQIGTGNYKLTITSANTFNDIKIDRSSASKSLTLPITMGGTKATTWTMLKSGTNTITIRSSEGGTRAKMEKVGGGVVNLEYIDVNDIDGDPGSTWDMGKLIASGGGSTDGGNNLDITFTYDSSPATPSYPRSRSRARQ